MRNFIPSFVRKRFNEWVCRKWGHNTEYRGYASCKATFYGQKWPFKCNYAVYVCKRCDWDNKKEDVKVEEIWRLDKHQLHKKRSLTG